MKLKLKRIKCSKRTRRLLKSGKKQLPNILTGIGIAGMIGAGCMAVYATPKAEQAIRRKKDELVEDGYEPRLTKKEVIQTTYKYYIPSVLLAASSAGLIVGGSIIHVKRNAALVSAYKLSEQALKDYHDQLVEDVGDEETRKIEEKLVNKRMDRKHQVETFEDESRPNNYIMPDRYIETGRGTDPFYDESSDRLCLCDLHAILEARDSINDRILAGMESFCTMNEWWMEWGMPPCALGHDLVFQPGHLCRPQIKTEMINGRPHGVIYFSEFDRPKPYVEDE